MNLTEKIALDCGLTISEPFIDEAFHPVVDENYIVIDTRSTYKEGKYDFYRDVFELIKDYLNQNNIKVFQFADENSAKLDCKKCFIKINKKQENYILKRSKLLVSNENYTLYTSSALGIPSVGLYSIFPSKSKAPIWNRNKQIILESDRLGNKPTYNLLNETPKTINLIDPYEVARKILQSLNIKNNLDKFELKYLGKSYNQKIVEIVPDFISEPSFLQNQSINLRLDYVKDLDIKVLQYWLNNRKVNIMTDKDMNSSILSHFKKNIVAITVMASDDISEQFLNICKSIGFNVKIYCSNKDRFNDFKFKFLDWEVEKDFNEENTISDFKAETNLKYVSAKTLFSKGKAFPSKAAYLLDKQLDKYGNSVILNEEFEQELEYFKIYNETKTLEKK